MPDRDYEGASRKSSTRSLEKCISGGAVSRNLVPVRLDSDDLCLEQGDPFSELVLREAVERFGGQLTGCIAARAGAVIVVHSVSRFGLPALAVNTAKG